MTLSDMLSFPHHSWGSGADQPTRHPRNSGGGLVMGAGCAGLVLATHQPWAT
ncbi:MAG: hypothetical protein M5U34_42960 [Chloroflexi bacterium]|nr:hypothetical protein [Chloroflexota bacterium]